MRHALTAAVAAAAVVLAGCSSASSSPSAGTEGSSAPASGSSPTGAALSWHPCTEQGSALQCSSLQVPLDYSHPRGRKITLALSEVPATAPASKRQGVLLVNPGGPGGSGLSLAAFVAQGLNHAVASEYTIVGFDTRGVGSSVPSMHCDPSFFSRARPDYIPATAAGEQVLENRA
jgi:pimeloyl-ACP methyl ester carboxylesterase